MLRYGLLVASAVLATLLTSCASSAPDTRAADVLALKDTEIVWVKVPRTGLRFLRIEPTHEVPFSQWLQSLSGDSHVRRP